MAFLVRTDIRADQCISKRRFGVTATAMDSTAMDSLASVFLSSSILFSGQGGKFAFPLHTQDESWLFFVFHSISPYRILAHIASI